MKFIIMICCLLTLQLRLLAQQSFVYNLQQLPQSGNPAGINQELDDQINAWQPITDDHEFMNSWSMPQPIPMPFEFFGQPVGMFQVSHNGLITFEGTFNSMSMQDIVQPPSGDNQVLPSSLLPDHTIACFWDEFTTQPPTMSGSKVYTKVFGQAPHRQYWIKWNNFEYGSPAVMSNTFACVLEEGTNAIYMIDMGLTTPPNVSATVGVQQNNTAAYALNTTNVGFSLSDNLPANNNQYAVIPDLGLAPIPLQTQGTPYSYSEINGYGTKYYWIEQSLGKTWCMDRNIEKLAIKITVDLGDDYELGKLPFNNQIELKLEGYSGWIQDNGVKGIDELISFEIDENKPEQVYYYQLPITLSYLDPADHNAPFMKQFKTSIINHTLSANPQVQSKLRVQVEIIEDYVFDVSTVVVENEPINASQYPTNLIWNSDCPDVENYEVQIMRLYNETGNNQDINKLITTLDWSKALSIYTASSNTNLALHLTEGTGYYLWRVRPIGDFYTGGIAHPKNWGDWSYNNSVFALGEVTEADILTADVGFFYTQFDADKNWIYNRSFAEENKIKEGIRYANGLGQSKQTQVRLQEDDYTIVHQNLYDYSGRSAIASLPAPVNSSHFGYVNEILTHNGALYTAADFDADDTYKAPHPIQDGAIQDYYSDENTVLTIPSAEGYPFSRTLFYADGDNRVYKQSGVGKELRLRTNVADEKVSKVFYGAVPELDLIRLFGEEAPTEASVYQVITQDANKTTSVDFINKAGQKIVTCLATSGASSALRPLASQAGALDTAIYYNTKNVPMGNGMGVSASTKIVLLTSASPVDFHFELTPDEITATCGSYCAKCDYLVTFTVISSIDPSDRRVFDLQIPSESCGTSKTFVHDTTLILSEGAHLVTKEIRSKTVNPLSQKTYLEEHLAVVASELDSLANEDLATVYGYLDTLGLEEMYAYLGIDLDTVPYDNNLRHTLTVADGCIKVDIPVLKCGPVSIPERATVDFEQMLYDQHEDITTIDKAPYHYFFHEGHLRYPHRATSVQIRKFDLPPAGNVFNLFYVNGASQKLAEMTIQYSTNALDAARQFCRDINNNHYYYGKYFYATYRGDIDNAEVHIFTQEKPMDRPYIGGIQDPHTGALVSFVNHYSSYGVGKIDQLVDQLILDGYAYEDIYKAWYALVVQHQSNGFMQNTAGDTIPNPNYDIIEVFLELLGSPRYTSLSTIQQGATGYHTAPNRILKYQPCVHCEDSLGFDPLNIWHQDSIQLWTTLRKCMSTYTKPKGKYSSNIPTACDDPKDIVCLNALKTELENTCNSLCVTRYKSFYNEVKEAYEDANIVASEACIRAAAWQMVYECQKDCALSVVYDSGGNPESVGTTAELQNYQQVFSSSVDISLATGGTCLSGARYVSALPLGGTYNPAQMTIDLLNYELKTAQNSQEILLYTPQQLINFCNSLLRHTAQIPLGCSLPSTIFMKLGDTTAYFRLGTGAMLELVEENTSTGTIVRVLPLCTTLNDFVAACDNFCFKWVPFELTDTITIVEFEPCIYQNAERIRASIKEQIQGQIQAVLDDLEASYLDVCLNPNTLKETHRIKHLRGYHHFTLYYYDRKGNLLQTVPPKGIDTVFYNKVNSANPVRWDQPKHTYRTTYSYNSLGQMLSKNTPDGGLTKYYHDQLGRIRFSQNAQQKLDNEYSYIKYDNLGRTTETGVGSGTESSFMPYINAVATYPTTGIEVRKSRYSIVSNTITYDYNKDGVAEKQQFTQNQLSEIYSEAGDTTWFSYDAHGNITWIVQHYPDLGKKTMAYYYDLLSGKINEIHYNKGYSDQFFHRYQYDSDNKVIATQTSENEVVWDTDARYEYYLNGSLKRTELGEDHVQGLDYVYTIQGWLKGINHSSAAHDPGQDGQGASKVGTDAFGMTLNYFAGDFQRSGSTYNNQISNSNLYNGLISSWETKDHFATAGGTMPSFSNAAYQGTSARKFGYDELGRLLNSAFSFYELGAWSDKTDYASSYSYDANGNIETLNRKAYAAAGVAQEMDDLSYHYPTGSNQLDHIEDTKSSTNHATDLDSQNAGNYGYNAIGELKRDLGEGITAILWTSSGKVKEVRKTGGINISFVYDTKDQRIQKIVNNSGTVSTTYYVRDAAGQTIATYKKASSSAPIQHLESLIQGGGRLGIRNQNAVVTPTLASTKVHNRYINQRHYELKDHLGNVRTTITDLKLPNGSTFEPNISSIQHYYPYGMAVPGMRFTSNNYRYGFQGMEKDDELKGEGNSYTTFFRAYDPRVGRWLSLDPKADQFPSWSPYKAFKNNPIYYTDPFGDAEPESELRPVRVAPPSTSCILDRISVYRKDDAKKEMSNNIPGGSNHIGFMTNDFGNMDHISAAYDNYALEFRRRNIPMEFFVQVAFAEGYVIYSHEKMSGTNDYTLRAQPYGATGRGDDKLYMDRPMGTDMIFNHIGTLKSKGYLPNDFVKGTAYVLTGNMVDKIDATSHMPAVEGYFTKPKYALQAVAAMILFHRDEFTSHAAKIGVDWKNMDQTQQLWWTYNFYNSAGARKALEAVFKEGRMPHQSKNHRLDQVSHANSITGGTLRLLNSGIFSDQEGSCIK